MRVTARERAILTQCESHRERERSIERKIELEVFERNENRDTDSAGVTEREREIPTQWESQRERDLSRER